MISTPTSFKRLALAIGRALVLAASALGSGAALAQAINDIPMAVKNNIPPNFMFMIDSSGSMLNIVPGAPYNAAATYLDTCPAASPEILIPAANNIIEIRVVTGGAPRARVGGVNREHVSVATTGNRICFNNTTEYRAALYFPVGGYGDSVYTGHYLNWYFGNYDGHPMTGWTDRKRLAAGTGTVTTRLDVAKASATSVIGTLPLATPASVRLGLSIFNGGDGGRLRIGMADLDATSRTAMTTSIAGINAGGTTPLAETLADIGRYMATGHSGNIVGATVNGVTINDFLRQNGRQSCLRDADCRTGQPSDADAAPTVGTPTRPIQYWCQRSYAFVLTDGQSNGDQAFTNNALLRDYDRDCQGALAATCVGGGVPGSWDRKTNRLQSYAADGSDYLDDVAKALFDMDLRPNLPSPDPVNRPKKNNLTTYTIGFADRALRNDPLLVSAARQGGGKPLFPANANELTAAFASVVTDAFAKDAAAAAVAVANAQITLGNTGYASSYRSGSWFGDLVAYSLDTSSALQTGSDLWSLRVNLQNQSPASRKIATFNGSTGVEFAAGLSYPGKPASLDDGVINYLRGDRSGEISPTNPTGPYRARQDVLADIINAEPVVVTYPGNVPIVFQGANGGMLHVVDGRIDAATPTRGQELWAYVPRLVHDNLAALADPSYIHQYYVDGTPAVAELSPTSRLLVGGLGKGGRGYFALDISSFTAATAADVASKVLWEFSPTGMGFSFGTPLIVRVGSNWRVVVPSGYDATVHGIWVLDPATGTGPFISAPSASGLAHLGKLANTAADADTRFVWGGDNVGNVFRFDLVSLTAVPIARLTAAGTGLAQPVTAPPEVGPVPGSTTRFLVQIGTGRYLADADVPGPGQNAEATQRQTVYGLVDDISVASPGLPNLRGTNGTVCPAGGGDGDLVCQSLSYITASDTYRATTHAVDLNVKRGWYVDLPIDANPVGKNMVNGRVVSKPALTTTGTLTLTVNIPTNETCNPGGRSWFLALNSTTGGGVPRDVGGNTYFDAGFFLGYALGSRPVIVITADGKKALIRMSDKKVEAPSVPEPATSAAQWRRIYFRPLK